MSGLFQGRNRITSAYRLAERPDHNGLDIVGDDSKDILCPVEGVVRSSTCITDKSNPTWQWGNYVRVDDLMGNRLFFCHMASRSVAVGQKVLPGDKLGVMGNTGYSFGAHTHFEVRAGDGKTILDPAAYLGIENRRGTFMAEEKDGWTLLAEGWRYCKDGTPLRSQWLQDGGYWYYLGTDGLMQTGLVRIDGKRYMLNPERSEDYPRGACIITDANGAIQG